MKKIAKTGIDHASPRGCDVALRAKWLCYVDARDGLRGTRMTRVHMFIIFYTLHMVHSKYKHSIEEFKLTA